MKTYNQIIDILDRYPLSRINSHVHTHVCDGAATMTVQNIADRAVAAGLSLIILVPHCHKKVTDGQTSLYEDTDVGIFEQLREEIEHYRKTDGKVEFLLSSEVDILSVHGKTSLPVCQTVEKCLDFVSPTLNYHPLLPLKAVAVTHIREVDAFHDEGRFAVMEAAAGGHQQVLESAYDAMIHAITHCPYPAMLGHYFISHTIPNQTKTWFGLRPEDMDLVREKTEQLLQTCQQKKTILDITGIHLMSCTAQEQKEKDGFLHEYQCYVLNRCKQLDIRFCAGSDAHNLNTISDVAAYKALFQW